MKTELDKLQELAEALDNDGHVSVDVWAALTEIAALREENASLKDELDNLEDVVLKMREENAKLREESGRPSGHHGPINEIASLREENEDLKAENEHLRKWNEKHNEWGASADEEISKLQKRADNFEQAWREQMAAAMALVGVVDSLRDVLESAPEPEMEDNHFTEASGQREEWAVDEAYGRWFHGPRAEALK